MPAVPAGAVPRGAVPIGMVLVAKVVALEVLLVALTMEAEVCAIVNVAVLLAPAMVTVALVTGTAELVVFNGATVAVLLKKVVLRIGMAELVWLRTGPTVTMGMVLEVTFIGVPRMTLVVVAFMLVWIGMEDEVVFAKTGAAVAVLFMDAVSVALELKLLVKVVCGTS